MTLTIHQRDVRPLDQEKVQNQTAKKSADFASLLQSVSEKKKTTREEQIQSAVSQASEKYNLPPDLITSVIKQESGGNPYAESPVGAQGLMQLMPETAKSLGVRNSFDIGQNVDGGASYLRQMLDRFDGDLPKALAAYNAGPGNVQKYNGIPPFAETQNYVKSIMASYQRSGGSTSVAVASHGEYEKAVASTAILQASLVSGIVTMKFPEGTRKMEIEEPPPPPPSRYPRV